MEMRVARDCSCGQDRIEWKKEGKNEPLFGLLALGLFYLSADKCFPSVRPRSHLVRPRSEVPSRGPAPIHVWR